jgi:iron complex outermembrane receptor protein
MMKESGKFRMVLMAIMMFVTHIALSQMGAIKGTVKDASGTPLRSASVALEGKKAGTTTDANGGYQLKLLPGSYTVVVSFVGQTPQKSQVVVQAGETVQKDFSLTEMADLGGVMVVGSRSRLQRSRLSSPVPVDIINTREIKSFAQTDITQLLTYVAPSFQSARQTVSDGTDHIDPAGLRGLGPDQTLVLVNGKRRHNTALVNINGTVGRGSVGTDLNAIPVAAIERIEVLRDGAAAQYGSDAIAGVINIVLKKNFNGFNVSAMSGENFTKMPYDGGIKINDGLTHQVDFSAGLANKKGAFINVSGQFLSRDRSNRSGDDNIPLVYYGNGGAFPTGAASVPAGDYRRYLIDLDKAYATQRGYNRHNIIAGNSAAVNTGAFINAALPVSARSSFYLTAGASHRNGNAAGFSRNPNSMSQQPVLSNGTRYYIDGFLPEIHTKIDDISLITGFKTNFDGWDFDLSNTVGQNTIKYNIENTGNASLPASNTVQTKFDAGKLIFLQNTVNADFSRGFTFGDKHSLNVAFGGEYRYENFQIRQGELNSYNNGLRVANFDSIPPYPGTTGYTKIASVATGSGSQVFPGFQPTDAINAQRNVVAGYIDLEYTLGNLLLGAAGRYEDYKETGFSYNGTGLKLTAKYDITPNIGIRASANTGFRAPSLHQRYFQNTSTQFVGGLPSQSLTANNNNPIVRNAFGIDELKPEKSYSYTAGIVGKAGKSFTFTVDGYFIHIDNRIVLSTAFNRSNPVAAPIFTANNIDPSVNALQFWTNAINTETKGLDIVLTNRWKLAAGNLTTSLATNFNKTSVVGGINTNSSIDAATNNPSKTDNTKNPANDLSNVLFDRQQRSRVEDGAPKNKINLTLSYGLPTWDFLVRAVRFGETKFLNNVDPSARKADGTYWNDVGLGTDQTFSAKITTDVVVTYKFFPGLAFAIGANNLLDTYPDRIFIDPRNAAATVYANPVASADPNKTPGGYGAGRDASNRGRFLFTTSQFGFNGRFLFARLNVDIGQLSQKK